MAIPDLAPGVALRPGELARMGAATIDAGPITSPSALLRDREAVAAHTLTAAADHVETPPVVAALAKALKGLVPRWLRPFVNIDAIAAAAVAFVAQLLDPQTPDPL